MNWFGGQFSWTQGYLHYLDLPPAVVLNVLNPPILYLLTGSWKRSPGEVREGPRRRRRLLGGTFGPRALV